MCGRAHKAACTMEVVAKELPVMLNYYFIKKKNSLVFAGIGNNPSGYSRKIIPSPVLDIPNTLYIYTFTIYSIHNNSLRKNIKLNSHSHSCIISSLPTAPHSTNILCRNFPSNSHFSLELVVPAQVSYTNRWE